MRFEPIHNIDWVAKGCALAIFDLASAIVYALIASTAFAVPAYAYVDPSVMTYTIQAIAGVAVALSAVAGVAFRRTRKALMRMLHIDENAHKEVESDVHRLDEHKQPIGLTRSTASSSHASGPKHASQSDGRDAEKKLSWPSRLWRAALAAVFTVGTVFFVAPVELVAEGSSSLVFGLSDVVGYLALYSIAIAAVIALVLSLLRGKAFDFCLMGVVALGICFYVQALFLNQTLPAADGTQLALSEHRTMVVVSGVVWVAIAALTVVLFVKRRQFGRGVFMFLSVALIFVQGVAVASVMTDQSNMRSLPAETTEQAPAPVSYPVVTQEGLFELAPDNNVVVFVLDAFDVINMSRVLEVQPDALDEMGGFTYFANSAGSSVPTRYGLPFLLTGSWPQHDETWQHYVDNRYASTTFTDDILKQGYSLYLYSDTLGPGGDQYLSTRATNIHELNESEIHTTLTINRDNAMLTLFRMGLYRDMTWALKKPFWFYTDKVNSDVVRSDSYETPIEGGRNGSKSPYVIDDASYYQQLKDIKLSVYDDGAAGQVHFIHLFGAHIPFTMNEYGQRSDTPTTADEQCIGSLRIVSEYLRQMKELGVYDNATIVITADHGYWFWDDTIEQSEADGDMAGGPIMLVKQPGTAQDSEAPVRISQARTGHVDYPATIIAAVGGDTGKYGPTVFEADDPTRVRYYYWPTHDGNRDLKIYEYVIDGPVDDWSSWSRTGIVWDYGKLPGEDPGQ